jgi:predicted porin
MVTVRAVLFMGLVSLCINKSALANGDASQTDGSCCGHLEERIKRLDDKAVESDTKKLYLSGHVNRGILWLDNKVNSNVAHVDNDNSASRLHLEGQASLNEDFATGAIFEVQMEPNSSAVNDVKNAEANSVAESRITIRKAELFFVSKTYGQITMGRGSMASDNTMEETDLSKTFVVSWGASGPAFLAGGATFTNKATGAKFTTSRVENIFDSGDGLSRRERILYSTPKYYGLSLHTSHGYQNTGDLSDIALKFAGKVMGTIIAADVALVKNKSVATTKYQQVDGSIGALFPLSFSGKEGAGFNTYFGTAHRDWDASGQSDGHVYFGKVGLIESLIPYGLTAFSVDWGTYKQMALDPNPSIRLRGESWGASLVQHLDVVATELYAGYRKYYFKRKNSGENYNPIDAVMVGARVKL